jgi:hypothetical protein
VKDSDLDTETIAALLAKRLGEPERAAALEQLASSGDDFRLFIEAAAVLRQIEEEEGAEGDSPAAAAHAADAGPERGEADASGAEASPVASPLPAPPSAAARWRRRSRAGWIAPVLLGAAAAIVLLVVLRRPSGPSGLAAPIALLSAPGLPSGTTEHHPWSRTLGTEGALTPTARAARAGALHTELALALRARDVTAAARVVAQIEAVLGGVSLAAPTAEVYRRAARAAANDPERSVALLAEAGEGAAALLGQDWMEAGAWSEAGRIAAATHDADFFSTPSARAALERIARLPGLGTPMRAAVERARAEVQAPPSPPRWEVLEDSMRELLRALAS